MDSQHKYEQKKALLQRIKNIFGDRLEGLRLIGRDFQKPGQYAEVVRLYTQAQERLDHFIKSSCYHLTLRKLQALDGS